MPNDKVMRGNNSTTNNYMLFSGYVELNGVGLLTLCVWVDSSFLTALYVLFSTFLRHLPLLLPFLFLNHSFTLLYFSLRSLLPITRLK